METKLQKQLEQELTKIGLAGTWLNGMFVFGTSSDVRAGTKVIRNKVWLEFDDAESLEGASLHIRPKKEWYRTWLANKHSEAVLTSIRLIDPDAAAVLEAEMKSAPRIGDLTAS